MIRKALLALAIILASLPAWSQVATGIYSYGTFENKGPDTLNVGNLNVHLNIPVLNKAGRGQAFTYDLSYDNSVWTPVATNGTKLWAPTQNWGWQGNSKIVFGSISYGANTTSKTYSGGQICYTTTYSNFTYYDSFGGVHSFPAVQTYQGNGSSPSCVTSSPTSSELALDGSGYTLSVTNYTNAVLVTPQGTTIVPSSSSSDANGNQITTNRSGVFTDTTGANLLTVSGGGNASSPQVFSYLTYGANPKSTTPPSASVTVTYLTHTVQTNFGCGVGEYNQSAALVDKITLADGSFYQFTYEPTPGNSSNVTGRLASISLPTGGTISYTYTGGSHGINCADGSTTGITRTTSDGTRTYVRSAITTTSSHTDIADDSSPANHSAFDFVTPGSSAAFYETNRANYQGSTSGAQLLSRQTCYNASTAPCTTTAVKLPITQIDTYETLFNGGLEHGATAKYNTYGLQTEQDTYDFGTASARGGLLRKELWVYPSTGIVSLLSSDTVQDGSANKISQTTYAYDETTGSGHAALAKTSGLPQHGGAVGTQRGNLTTVTQWNNLGTSIVTASAYEDTGNPVSTLTPNGTTGFSYDPATHVFLNTTTPPTPSSGVALSSSATYDANTGVLLTTTDANSQTTTYKSYDELLRPTEIDFPDGGKTYPVYTSPNVQYVQTLQNSSNTYGYTYADFDSLGRTDRAAVYNGQGGSPWYQQDGCFDANGHLGFQSYAYQNTGFNYPKQCSGAGDTYSYDGLARVISVTHADGTSIGYTYNGRATRVKDENGVTRISQIDGLGRPLSVCEVSSASQQSVAPVACGQAIAATGFLTTYSYTTGTSNDQVTTITQGVQTRTFVTDSLGRTVSTTEPERETTTYSYAYNGTGLVMTRKRPQANQTNPSVLTTTTTQYDSLGRVVSVSYSDGTPAKSFAYDKNAWVWSNFAPTNLKGRMYLASSQANANTTFSYDAMGRINEMAECTPSGCGNGAYDKHIVYSYDWAGNLTSEWDPAAGNITYGRSPAGEITSVTNQTYTLSGSSGSAALLSNAANGPNGPISYNLGNGLSEYNEYDSLGRINGGWVCIGAPSLACPNQRNGFALNWSGSRVSGATENYLGTLYYQYDDFNRLTGMENSALQPLYSYVYDRYGNRWQQNALQGGAGFSQLYTAATNQLSSGGYQYDAAGNMTYDASGGHHFTYDAEGNILQVDAGSWSFVFDAFNHRVRAQAAGVLAENLFDAFGHDTSGWSGPSTPGESHIFADNTQIALRSGDGETYFNHTNWLKTDRVHTDMNGATAAIFTSLPFGDGGSADVIEYYAGWDFQHFAGMDVDYWDSTYYAQFRNYSELQARWLSPDPYNGSYDASNPQSFNRYAYVLNNPLSFTDPLGLEVVPCPPDDPNNPTFCVVTTGGGQGGGGGIGGGGRGHNPWIPKPGPPHPKRPKQPKTTATTTCWDLASGNIPSESFSSWLAGYTNASSMLDNWIAGTGATDTIFGPDSPESQEMMGAYNLSANVSAFLGGGEPTGFQNFGLEGLLASGLNPTAQFVGSYGWSMSLSDGDLNITLTNATTMYSAFYHAPGFDPNPPTVGGSVLSPGQRLPMGRVNQTFEIQVPCP